MSASDRRTTITQSEFAADYTDMISDLTGIPRSEIYNTGVVVLAAVIGGVRNGHPLLIRYSDGTKQSDYALELLCADILTALNNKAEQ